MQVPPEHDTHIGNNGHRSRVLVVDDEIPIRKSLASALDAAGYEVDQAARGREALRALRRGVDVVLLDSRLPDLTGLECLREMRRVAPRVPVVMIAAFASVDDAIKAFREGVFDFLPKPFETETAIEAVGQAIESSRPAAVRTGVLRAGGKTVVAESPAMKGVLDLVRRIGCSGASTVLLLGETGVGKGLVARLLHHHPAGEAHAGPFVNITCTALAEPLLESELFGHEKGAFTGAQGRKPGLFELADGGTVFLDEIGDLSPRLQGKLIRFLEERTFRRVGGTKDIHVSVRVVAATNRDLAHEVEAGNFRADLYFRLRVIPIVIPPLRERPEDLAALVGGFLRQFAKRFGASVREVGAEAWSCLERYSWPGNVRELRNAIERAVLLAEHDELRPEDLPPELGGAPAFAFEGATAPGFTLPPGGIALDEVERSLVLQALRRTGGNRTRAARLLGLNRDQIRYRIEKFAIEAEAERA